jgi:hypothetical protein
MRRRHLRTRIAQCLLAAAAAALRRAPREPWRGRGAWADGQVWVPVLLPRRPREGTVCAYGQRPRGDSVDRDDQVLVALERVDCAPRMDAERTVGERKGLDDCDEAACDEAYDGAAAAGKQASAVIALGDAGHEEPFELSHEWAGLPGGSTSVR